MGWKEQFGIEAGLQGMSKIPDHIVSKREGDELAAKAKREQDLKKTLGITTAFQETLWEKVKKKELTPHQAEMLERGANARLVFNNYK